MPVDIICTHHLINDRTPSASIPLSFVNPSVKICCHVVMDPSTSHNGVLTSSAMETSMKDKYIER